MYTDRRAHIIKEINREADLLKTRVRFIEDFINDNIQIIKKRKSEIEDQLVYLKYPKIDDSYDYLLKMPIYSLSMDKIDEFKAKIANLESELQIITDKNEKTLWLEDLESVEKGLSNLIGNTPQKKKFVFKPK